MPRAIRDADDAYYKRTGKTPDTTGVKKWFRTGGGKIIAKGAITGSGPKRNPNLPSYIKNPFKR